ncbi:MAG: hypothetical protein MI862_01450 [Desulfobacterales bacterium]|nr:hypothetical protein [Desulfobacterales bacterium]
MEELIKEVTLQYNREAGVFHTRNRGGYSDASADLDEALKDFEAIARSELERENKNTPVKVVKDNPEIQIPCENCPEWETLKHNNYPWLIHCPTCGRALK